MKGFIEIPFAIGSEAWWVGPAYRTEWVKCPDCAGTKALRVILGNGDEHTLACGLCSVGYEPPSGVIEHTVCGYKPTKVTLLECSDAGREDARYTIPCTERTGNVAYAKDLYATEEECLSACEVKRAEEQANRDRQERATLASKRDGLAFSVSYWRGQVKRYRESMERCQRYLGESLEKREESSK